MSDPASTESAPVGSAEMSFSQALRADLLSGFLVFLIALPLCLAIAKASNFPPVCGIWTAVLGGLIATWISDSQLTIKGPAAGLIVIVAGAVIDLGNAFGPATPEGVVGVEAQQIETARMFLGYQLTLAVGVVAGAIQIVFGLLRIGRLGDWFPLAAVHGLLAAIGIIIFSKQLPVVLGVAVPREWGPLKLLSELPNTVRHLNPAIALIGLSSLMILFGLPLIKNKYVRRIPAPMVVLLLAIPLGKAVNLDVEHTYLFPETFSDAFHADPDAEQHFETFNVGPKFLVEMPSVLEDPWSAFFFPDFSHVFSLVSLKYIILFSLIGTLESLLSAKAVDLLDAKKRKTNLDRDLTGIGVANTVAAFIGGLPMISEIVRSSANNANGAQTRRANFFHGVFLLGFVLFLPNLIHSIPLAALGAMLVFTGFRLAHPYEFIKTWKIGKEQLIVFLTTIFITLYEDMLIGVLAGVAVEFLLHLLHGAPIRSAWKSNIETESSDSTYRITVRDAAIFTNWLQIKSQINKFGTNATVTLDMTDVHLIDHSVMEKLHELEKDFELAGGKLSIVGLDGHLSLSRHPQASRKKPRESAQPAKV